MIEDETKIKQAKAENLLRRLHNLVDNYNPLESSELLDKEINEKIKLVSELLSDVGVDLEVENFLLYGPGGEDPKETTNK